MDKHFSTNGNWSGLSLGWVTVVWLTFILCEGNHRLYQVEGWVRGHLRTLSRVLGRKVEPRDLTDDRLAKVLDYLSVEERWVECERELNQRVLRSLAFAESQERSLRQRVARTVTEINALDERKKGKTRLPEEAAARQATEAISAKHRVGELVNVYVTTETHEQVKRRYATRPATTVRSERVRVRAARD